MPVQTEAVLSKTLKRVGIAADHGGFELKEFLAGKLREAGYEVSDFGDRQLKSDDDYPEYTDESLVTRDYEIGLHAHYNRKGYWIDELVNS